MTNIISTDATPRVSNTSKMPCKSWSLEAVDTCPGSREPKTGELVEACQGCYAVGGFYNMPTVKAPRAHNKQDWKKHDWVQAMVAEIGKGKLFRWFDSGDCYSVALAEKIYQVMVLTPNCKHWLPTRSHKFSKFASVFRKMELLENVAVRKSSDSVSGKTIRGKTTSTIISLESQVTPKMHVCPATKPGASPKCKANNCNACWDKTVPVIAYHFH